MEELAWKHVFVKKRKERIFKQHENLFRSNGFFLYQPLKNRKYLNKQICYTIIKNGLRVKDVILNRKKYTLTHYTVFLFFPYLFKNISNNESQHFKKTWCVIGCWRSIRNLIWPYDIFMSCSSYALWQKSSYTLSKNIISSFKGFLSSLLSKWISGQTYFLKSSSLLKYFHLLN